jgi:pyridoxine 5-phosphate synthase
MRRRRLGVNVDHVATLRQLRRTTYPDPVAAVACAEQAGADQITIHLREDRRHVQDRDLRLLRETVATRLNLEMAATADMVKTAYDIKPDMATLVPERREQLTTEGGLDVGHQRDTVRKYIQNLRDGDIDVSLFIDPDLEQVRAAHRLEVTMIELHAGKYCDARGEADRNAELTRLLDAARTAQKLGMRVAAGRGLNYQNILPLVQFDEIEEYNIGHSIVARALFVGFERAVRDLLALLTF